MLLLYLEWHKCYFDLLENGDILTLFCCLFFDYCPITVSLVLAKLMNILSSVVYTAIDYSYSFFVLVVLNVLIWKILGLILLRVLCRHCKRYSLFVSNSLLSLLSKNLRLTVAM